MHFTCRARVTRFVLATQAAVLRSKTIRGKLENLAGYGFVVYCTYKIIKCTVNIIFSLDPKKDPISRSFELTLKVRAPSERSTTLPPCITPFCVCMLATDPECGSTRGVGAARVFHFGWLPCVCLRAWILEAVHQGASGGAAVLGWVVLNSMQSIVCACV